MRPSKNYVPPEQLEAILSMIPRLKIRKWKDEDVKMLFKVMYWLTLRFNEAARLKAEDFDITNKRVYLGKTKAGKEDYAPIPPPFTGELAAWLLDKSGPLFPGLTYGTVIKWIYRLGNLLDIPAWTSNEKVTGEKTKTHIFRKSMGKDMLYGTHGIKAPVNVISKQLRHTGKRALESTWQYLKMDIEGVNQFWEDNEGMRNRDQII